MATSDQYLRLLQSLLPQGAAWPRDEESALTALLGALADELARLHNRAEELFNEADPRVTLEMLTDWERATGLPDSCTGAADTIQERREFLVQRLTSRGGQSIAYFREVATAIGYDNVTIEEYSPFECGASECGDPLNGSSSVRYEWRVLVPGPRVTDFQCGESECGDPLGDIDKAADLECLLTRLKPAQSSLIFAYQGA